MGRVREYVSDNTLVSMESLSASNFPQQTYVQKDERSRRFRGRKRKHGKIACEKRTNSNEFKTKLANRYCFSIRGAGRGGSEIHASNILTINLTHFQVV